MSRMSTTPIAFALLVGTLMQLGMTLALTWWGRWVARRMENRRFWRIAAWSPWASFVLLSTGTIVGVYSLSRAFDAIAAEDPSNKARVLGQSISDAMNLSAVLFLPGYAVLLFAVIAFIVGSVRRGAAAPDS
jgi:cytochrome bd-type quinol oxidase subunit 1